MAHVLFYVGAGMVGLWGIAHLLNTKGALLSFEPMTVDTHRIVAMEWIVEGLTLNFIAAIVVATTLMRGVGGATSTFVYRASAVMLIVMALVSLFTGARVRFWAYKLCPVVFGTSAMLFFVGSLLV